MPDVPKRRSFVERRSGADLDRALRRGVVDFAPWAEHGAVATAIGFGLAAAVLLAWDLVRGVPLETPYALGSALFRGAPPVQGSPISWPLVLGYGAAHLAVIAGFAPIAAYALALRRRPIPPGLLAVLLLLALETVFVALGFVFLGRRIDWLAGGPVLAANAVAAIGMTVYLRLAWRTSLRPPPPRLVEPAPPPGT